MEKDSRPLGHMKLLIKLIDLSLFSRELSISIWLATLRKLFAIFSASVLIYCPERKEQTKTQILARASAKIHSSF